MRYLGAGFVSFDLVSLSVRIVSRSRLLFSSYSESSANKFCMYRYADFSVSLLGCDDHDISTMIKQLKIANENDYRLEERIEFRPTIWKDLLETSRNIVQVLRALHAEPATSSSEVRYVSCVWIFSIHNGSSDRPAGGALRNIRPPMPKLTFHRIPSSLRQFEICGPTT